MRYKDYKGVTGSYDWINKINNSITTTITRNIGKSIKSDLKLGFNFDDYHIVVNAYPIQEELIEKVIEEDEAIIIKMFYRFDNNDKSITTSIYKLTADSKSEVVCDDFTKLKGIVFKKFGYNIKY